MTNTRAILTGDTYPVRAALAANGWKWDADRQAWTKIAEWDDSADVISSVRRYGGIRNRGQFTATLETV